MEKIAHPEVKKYFAKFPVWTVLLMVAAVLLIVFYSTGWEVVLIAAAVWGFVSWIKMPTDRQVDNLLKTEIKNLKNKARVKTGLDRSEFIAEPVILQGPHFWDVGDKQFDFKKGKDETIRFTPIGVLIIQFAKEKLMCYTCVLDLTEGKPFNESMTAFSYKDVESVSARAKTHYRPISLSEANLKKLAKGPLGRFIEKRNFKLSDAETFYITLNDGNSVEMILRDRKVIEALKGKDVPSIFAEKAVQSVRKILKNKNGAID